MTAERSGVSRPHRRSLRRVRQGAAGSRRRTISRTRSNAVDRRQARSAVAETRAVGCILSDLVEMRAALRLRPAAPRRPARSAALLCTCCTLSVQRDAACARARPFPRDIAPIVFDACVSCHRPAGPARFRLTTYDEVRRRATQIAQVTRSRFMPPWKVEPGVGHFVGQRPLDRQRDRADRAVGAATARREGDPADLPPLPKLRRWLAARHSPI